MIARRTLAVLLIVSPFIALYIAVAVALGDWALAATIFAGSVGAVAAVFGITVGALLLWEADR